MLNFTKPIFVTIVFSTSLLFAYPSHAEDDPGDTCKSAASLFNDGDLESALEEARWCVTQLEQLKQGQTSSYFKDEINGYTGGTLESQQVMGFAMTERTYSKGNKSIKISLTGGASGAANNVFSAITAFGMQAAAGQKIRIHRRTAVLSNDNGTISLVITLRNGGMLTLETGNATEEELIELGKAFPLVELDDSRR